MYMVGRILAPITYRHLCYHASEYAILHGRGDVADVQAHLMYGEFRSRPLQ